MDSTLVTSTIFLYVLGLATVFFVSLYYRLKKPSRALTFWTVGWFIYLISNMIELFLSISGGPFAAIKTDAFLAFIRMALVNISFVFWYLGIGELIFIKNQMKYAILVAACAAGILWPAYAAFVLKDFVALASGTSVLSAIILGAALYYFLLYRRMNPSIGSNIVVAGLALSVIHHMDYPFLRGVEWFAPFGFVIGTIIKMMVGIGFIILLRSNKWEITDKRARTKRK